MESDLDSLPSIHLQLYFMPSEPFRALTGCLQPCTHSTYEYGRRTLRQESFFHPFGPEGGRNVSGLGVSLYSTNRKIVRYTV